MLRWLGKADTYFAAAEQLSTQGERFREIIAFHCPQAVGKYLKAFPIWRQIEFPKTHDVAKLLARVATVNANLAESLGDADMLTPFGVEARYPTRRNFFRATTEAIDMAHRVKNAVMISFQPYLDGG
ncbi:MAG: HEPN domain-containing protein [Bryobacteraceae bacterium]